MSVQSINLKEWVEEVFGTKFANKVDESLEIIVVEASAPEEDEEGDEEEEDDEEEESDDEEEESDDEEEESDDEEEEEGEDLMAIADVADSGGKSKAVKEAQARLTELAEEQDFDVESVNTWTEVAEYLTEEGGEEEEEGDEEEEDEDEEDEVQEPQKGEVCFFKPPKARKNVECEVVKVLKSKETVDLKNLENDKIYKAVDWSELIWE